MRPGGMGVSVAAFGLAVAPAAWLAAANQPATRTRRQRVRWTARAHSSARRLVVGLNKYSHDAGVCIADASTGEILVAVAKERISRVKHDGGGIGQVLAACCDEIGAKMDDIELVVSNNHHFRIRPFEESLRHFGLPLDLYDSAEYGDDWNLLPGIRKIELSHHLAHAWSVTPFCANISSGDLADAVVVVMDGMGESFREMSKSAQDSGYFSDLKWFEEDSIWPKMMESDSSTGYREAETVYGMDEKGRITQGLWKRWTRENSPPELYNHGFQDMESCGAVYSRVSSTIFRNWNQCGKVMGLAPYAGQSSEEKSLHKTVMSGDLSTDELKVNWELLNQVGIAREWNVEEDQAKYASLANDVQSDLESVTLGFLAYLRRKFKAKTLCFCGGVALNSTLNGRIARGSGFENFVVTPYPGDEGIAIGCAMFGVDLVGKIKRPRFTLSPYLGLSYKQDDVDDAIEELAPWLNYEPCSSIVPKAADLLLKGKVIGWYNGRSEVGPRALGNRSIVADPRSDKVKDFINSEIKNRENFRPLAPVVLEEHVKSFFEETHIRPDKMRHVPAVTHVDGTARLQTLRRQDNPSFYDLIQTFATMGGLPILLNTSFNIAGQPIVETPLEALYALLDSSLDAVAFEGGVVSKLTLPSDEQLVNNYSVESMCSLGRIDQSSGTDGTVWRTVAHTDDRSVPIDEEEADMLRRIACSELTAVSELLLDCDGAEENSLRVVRKLHEKRLVALVVQA